MTATAGQPVTIKVTAEGTSPFSYQWRKNSVAISGATSATFAIASAATSDTAIYSAVVSNAYGSTISDDAALTVNSAAVAPAITTQPTSLTVNTAQSASFSVSVTGTAPLTYQWRKNSTTISGATAAAYTIASASSSDCADYSVVVTNSAGSVTSNAATLTVNSPVTSPVITSQPASLVVTEGLSASFSVTATGSSLSYQWYKNGVSLSGATGMTYAIGAVATGDAGNYSVVVTNSAGSVTSSSAALTVSPRLVAPTITAQPTAVTVTAGQSAAFSVTASGSGILTYQWQMAGTAIAGATASTYTITATTSADAGAYSVVVSNAAGSVVSNSVTLTVNPAITLAELIPLSFSARGENGATEGIAKLFDGSVQTKWLDLSATTWIKVTFAAPTVLQAYSLSSANDYPERDPASWTLSGSNDGVVWTVIESRTSQSWASRFLCRDFIPPATTTAYTQYRFDFKATSGSITQLAEMELYGYTVNTVRLTPSSYSARGQASSSQGIAKLFDGKSNTKWVDRSGTTWVRVNLSAAATLRRYTLTSAADMPQYDPVSWTLYGSNDGTNWTSIETRTAQSWSSRRLMREFVIASPAAAFARYRFDIKSASSSTTQLADLQLFGTP